jgi:hypothetical protein
MYSQFVPVSLCSVNYIYLIYSEGRSQWPHGFRCEMFSPAQTLEYSSNPKKTWMFLGVYFVLWCSVQVMALRQAGHTYELSYQLDITLQFQN